MGNPGDVVRACVRAHAFVRVGGSCHLFEEVTVDNCLLITAFHAMFHSMTQLDARNKEA